MRETSLLPFLIEGSSTVVVRPGYCHYQVLAVNNGDVRQPNLLDISYDGVNISQ